jgi:hypothetical protein
MLIRSLFGWNSSCTIRIADRSYRVRSALATKASASSSLCSFGGFYFIGINLFLVHKAGADWANERCTTAISQRKYGQHVSPAAEPPDCLEPFFLIGMDWVRENRKLPVKYALNDGKRNAVFLAFSGLPASQSNPAAVNFTR